MHVDPEQRFLRRIHLQRLVYFNFDVYVDGIDHSLVEMHGAQIERRPMLMSGGGTASWAGGVVVVSSSVWVSVAAEHGAMRLVRQWMRWHDQKALPHGKPTPPLTPGQRASCNVYTAAVSRAGPGALSQSARFERLQDLKPYHLRHPRLIKQGRMTLRTTTTFRGDVHDAPKWPSEATG
ncbi:hypothetical protein N9L68_06875 [bacterium]|nr:hypothetical protein [bacterium]